MIPLLTALAAKGLGLLGDAIVAKGKAAIEAKLGVKIPSTEAELTPEVTEKLLTAQNLHEQFLINAALEEKKLDIAAGDSASKEVTARWAADMGSDNQLSKNIRPATLIYLLAIFSISAIAATFGKPMPDAYLTVLSGLLELAVGAYFVGRTAEKGVNTVLAIMESRKTTKGN